MPIRVTSAAARRLATGLLLLAGLALSGCLNFPEGETTCPGQGPNSGSWPYCNPAEPGGSLPGDERIDPSGPY